MVSASEKTVVRSVDAASASHPHRSSKVVMASTASERRPHATCSVTQVSIQPDGAFWGIYTCVAKLVTKHFDLQKLLPVAWIGTTPRFQRGGDRQDERWLSSVPIKP
mgnify:CR=1 FL=1